MDVRESGKQLEPSSLSFDSHADALNFARHCVQNGNNWLAAHSVNIAERYERLECDVNLRLCSSRNGVDYQLQFHRIPSGWPDEVATTVDSHVSNVGAARGDGNGNNDLVFVGVSNLVYSPKQVIPSLVWLKRDHQVEDFFGNVLGRAFYQSVLVNAPSQDFALGVPERKLSVFPVCSGEKADSMSGLVEGGAQIDDGVERYSGQRNWHRLNELDLMYVLSSVFIRLDDTGVWVSGEERADLGLHLANVSLGVFNAVA